MDLETLIASCREGDEQAMIALFERFRPSALRLASALVSEPSLSEDAVQDAFLTAIGKLDQLRSASAFPAWWRQIVRSACRRYRAAPRTDPLDAAGDRADPTPAAEDILLSDERSGRIRRAIEALPPRGRETTELFYLEERSHAEISELLGVPKGTVKRRLHDARNRLRTMMLGWIDDESDRPFHRDYPL